MKKMKAIILSVLFLAVIILSFILSSLLRKLQEVPENPPGTLGNTAGNLYNGGLFCQLEDKVFFSNPYDQGSLYVMNSDQSNIHRLTTGTISQINAAGDYIYYQATSSGAQGGLGYLRSAYGIYRSNITGQNSNLLINSLSDSMLLVQDTLYYTNFTENEELAKADVSLHCIDTNGKESQSFFTEHIKLGAAYGDNLLFAGMNKDHYLYSFNLMTLEKEVLSTESMYLPVLQNGIVYYLDVLDDYHLKALNLGSGEITTLVSQRIDAFNLYETVIYFQTADPEDYALKRIYFDGTGLETVYTGVFKNIQITEEYTYFMPFGDAIKLYMTPTFGPVDVEEFEKAREAAFAAS